MATLTPTLHTRKLHPRAWLNRAFSFIYTIAIFFLFYHHLQNLIHSPNTLITLLLILADLVLAFMWIIYQAFHLNPIQRHVFPENLPQVAKESEYLGLDVFICTADPFKEPPMGVLNTALSVLAYDYPVEKLSVYVSDDGGSQLTLFAFMEAAKFAKHWLPYCKKNNIIDRCPELYFESNNDLLPETNKIKLLYDDMKENVEKIVERGSIHMDPLSDPFSKWTTDFSPQHHSPIIKVLIDGMVDKNVDGDMMPNLIYVSRGKSKVKLHNFKAGALNVLVRLSSWKNLRKMLGKNNIRYKNQLRVSSTMTNAPIFLVLDCDMYSNDPKTPLRALCYFMDPLMDPKLAFVQFPSRFRGINKDDIYNGEYKIPIKLDPLGFDGLLGPDFMGSGAFFRRLARFDATSSFDILQDGPIIVDFRSKNILELAHHVAGCNYEDNTKWGSEIGFRYGTLSEDVFTSYCLQCEGWRSVFCNPERVAFLGNAPSNLYDFLSQIKRWHMGNLQLMFSKFSPITFGLKSMKNPLQALCFLYYMCWPFWSIPIIIYAFLPQLMLIKSFPIFPKVSDSWFLLYAFLFLGAYGKHIFNFTIEGGPILKRWWNCQRMWLIFGVSSFPFGLLEFTLKSIGIARFGFNVTSKVIDKEQGKRYEQGMFEFGIASPMFFAIAIAATVNLFAFVRGMSLLVLGDERVDELSIQVFLAGFVVVNSWPVYEAMVLRGDQGNMPFKITLTAIAFACLFSTAS